VAWKRGVSLEVALADRMVVQVKFHKQIRAAKGEDVAVAGEEVTVCDRLLRVFAVFDGHGGRSSAETCGRLLPRLLLESLQRRSADVQSMPSEFEQELAFNEALNAALKEIFHSLDEECKSLKDGSGTTATVAILSDSLVAGKWASVTVANVGDSHVFAEVKKSLLRLNEDQRLDTSEKERERIVAAGGEVARKNEYDVEQPLRLWPGGLMMGRSIGDPEAPHAIADPAINNLMVRLHDVDEETSIPFRLILASDGLWDALAPRQSFSLVRKKPIQPAAQILLKQAAQKAGKDHDDISVVIIDISDDELASRDSMHSFAFIGPVASSFKIYRLWDPNVDNNPWEQILKDEEALKTERQDQRERNERLEKEKEFLRVAAVQSDNAIDDDVQEEGTHGWEEVTHSRGNPSKTKPGKERNDEPVKKTRNKRGGRKKKAKVCFAFKRGETCGRGEACPFLHEISPKEVSEEQVETAPKDPGICFSFCRGDTCERGDACHFRHHLFSGEELQSSVDLNLPDPEEPSRRPSNLEEMAQAEAENAGSSWADLTEDDPPNILEKLNETGRRNRRMRGGQKRNNSRKKTEKTSEVIASATDKVREKSNRDAAVSNLDYCFQYRQRGTCQYGDKCKFSHDLSKIEESPELLELEKKPKLCYGFQRRGTCKYGDSCKFVHDVHKKPNKFEICVEGLTNEIDYASLRSYFEEFGQLSALSHKPKDGIALVAFENVFHTSNVLCKLDHRINNIPVRVTRIV